LFADVPQALLAGAGVFTRNHSHVGADVLATSKPSWSSDDQHVGECRKRTNTGMGHQSQQLGSLSGFPLHGGGQLFNRRIHTVPVTPTTLAGDSKEKVRSALNRATRKAGRKVATATDATFFYVWNGNTSRQ
jgi:hypothetical protein